LGESVKALAKTIKLDLEAEKGIDLLGFSSFLSAMQGFGGQFF